MTRTWRTLVALLASGVLLAACAGSEPGAVDRSGEAGVSSEDDELVVCISGMVTPEEGLPYYQGLSEYVAEKAGLELRLIHKAEYAELNRLLESGEVDMAFSCSGPYVTGHEEFGLELLAAPVVNGTATYQAYIIVPSDSAVTSIDELEGGSFAFTDPESNTGCLVPTYMLALNGVTPEEFFGRVIYTYSHDNSIRAVANHEVDGASVDSLIWEYTNATDPEFTSQTTIITRSEPFAIPPVVVRPDLDPEVKARLQQAFLTAHEDPEGAALLAQMHMERFVEIADSDFDSVREMAEWVKSCATP